MLLQWEKEGFVIHFEVKEIGQGRYGRYAFQGQAEEAYNKVLEHVTRGDFRIMIKDKLKLELILT